MNILCQKCDILLQGALLAFTEEASSERSTWKSDFWCIHKWEANALSSSCHLCTLFYYTIIDYSPEPRNTPDCGHFEPEDIFCSVDVSVDDPNLGLLALNIPLADRSTSRRKVEIKLFDKDFDITANAPSITSLSTPTWNVETLRQVKDWLSTCSTTHPRCISQSQTGHYPLRLVDVDPKRHLQAIPEYLTDINRFSIEAVPGVRVCRRESLPQNAKYLTLSYRWHNPPAILLSNDTLTLFTTEIPLEMLYRRGAKIIRDAIQVTRSLGCRYLWIDALCINQDDEVEKAVEISSMDLVYTNSAANISATGATQVADGLVFERNLLAMNPCRKSFDSAGTRIDLVVFPDLEPNWTSEVNFAPVNQRAWVYQERMLSPRVIHFCQRQIFWECFTMKVCEKYPEKDSRTVSMLGDKSNIFIDRNVSTNNIDQYTEAERWHRIVEHFSRHSLTFSTDRLLAISSLARHICTKRHFSPHHYCAGHWLPDLLFSLLWKVTETWRMGGSYRQCRCEGEAYVSPSWSWASVESDVTFRRSPGVPLAYIASAATALKDGDPFGKVVSGTIFLHCFLCPFLWYPDSQQIGFILPDGKTWKKSCMLGLGLHTSMVYSNVMVLFDNGGISGELWVQLSDTDSQLHISDMTYFMAPIMGDSSPSSYLDAHNRIDGLILHRTLQPGQYVRVGYFIILPGIPPGRVDEAGSDTNDEPLAEQDLTANDEFHTDVATGSLATIDLTTRDYNDGSFSFQKGVNADANCNIEDGDSTVIPAISTVQSSNDTNDSDLDLDIRPVLFGKMHQLDASDYLEVMKDGKYLIEIV